MAKKLFDGDASSGSDDEPEIEINEEYAKRLEHNKKREELQRYEEMKKKGEINDSDDSDDESDDEDDDVEIDGGEKVRKRDNEFIDVLLKVKQRDPSLKEKDVKLFASDDDESSDEGNGESSSKKQKKKKAMYLKDVVAKHLIEEGPEMGENDGHTVKKSYMEEQEEIKKEFLDVAGEIDNDEDDFLKPKKKDSDDEADEADEEVSKKWDEYLGGNDGKLDENELFLKDFFTNKMWIDKENKGKKIVLDDEDVLEEDDEELEKQEDFETNFRYEENANDRVLGYSRIVDDSVRNKDNPRKKQRKNKEERKKLEELERMEERKRLKNLKKQEIAEKMKKVMSIAGIKEEEQFLLKAKDLDREFDPEEYDKLMNALYNEEYYGKEDANPSFVKDGDEDNDGDAEKPDFEKEDELLGLPKNWDALESNDGFLAAREKSLKIKSEKMGDEEEEEEEEEEESEEEMQEHENEEEKPEVSKKRKRKMSLVKKAREEMMEEYYKLDYEDTIGDLKTRFNYAKVKPNKYGLSTAEILMMDDNELKQYVSLKKIAPFREDEYTVSKRKKHQQKLKNMELFQKAKSDHVKTGHKKKHKTSGEKSTSEVVNNKDENDQVEGETNKLSARAKARRRQAGPKLTQSRSIAYGLVQPKSKGKGKN